MYEDALAFGAALLRLDNGKKPRAVHPAEADNSWEGAWRIELFMKQDDPDRIYGRITDEDVIHAEIVGALFLDKKPCCGNLEVARRIRSASLLPHNKDSQE